MNIILLDRNEISEDVVIVKGERARHVVKILRASCGQKLRVGLLNGMLGFGTIEELDKRQPYSVTLRVTLSEPCPPLPPIDLVLALPRPIMLKRILSQATTLGVGTFFIINSRRVEKSYWESQLITQQLYHEHLLKGLEQAIDTRVPSVAFYKGFKPFLQKTVPEIKSIYAQMLLAHPESADSLKSLEPAGSGRTLLAIGPEGGWVDYEIEQMKAAGFFSFGIGQRILRVDTAVIALHSMISQFNSKN